MCTHGWCVDVFVCACVQNGGKHDIVSILGKCNVPGKHFLWVMCVCQCVYMHVCMKKKSMKRTCLQWPTYLEYNLLHFLVLIICTHKSGCKCACVCTCRYKLQMHVDRNVWNWWICTLDKSTSILKAVYPISWNSNYLYECTFSMFIMCVHLNTNYYVEVTSSPSRKVSSWMDRKVVTVMSTTSLLDTGTVLRQQKDGSRIPVPCPLSIIDYNNFMGGVDRGDQVRGYCSCRTKCRKIYKYMWRSTTKPIILHWASIWDNSQNSRPRWLLSIFTFWHGSIEESFLYTKICFVASRTLYLPSYGSKKSAV